MAKRIYYSFSVVNLTFTIVQYGQWGLYHCCLQQSNIFVIINGIGQVISYENYASEHNELNDR